MSQVHVKFPAGRSIRRSEDSNVVDPQPERGLLYLTEEDGLLHFCWKDGGSGNVDDLILFPGDATFQPVPNSARSYVLKFSSSDARHFYWCQDVDSSKDSERAGIINSLISESSEDVAMEGPSDPASDPAPAPAPTPAPVLAAPTTSPAPTSSQSNDFASILQQFASSHQSQEYEAFSLPDVVTPSVVLPLLSNPTVREALYPFLPSGLEHTEETLRSVVQSTELRRSLAGLDAALRSGLLGPFVQGLGLDSEAAMGVDNFLKAIQEKADREKANEGQGEMETD